MPPEVTWIDLQEPANVTKRLHARLAREALRRVAKYHLLVRMGKHFKELPETEPGGGYGYEQRSARYNAFKKRKFGHTRPNDRTGRLKRTIRANSQIRGTQYKASLRLRGYFPMTEQRRRELEAMTPAEKAESNVQAHEFYVEEANKPENQRQRAPKKRIT